MIFPFSPLSPPPQFRETNSVFLHDTERVQMYLAFWVALSRSLAGHLGEQAAVVVQLWPARPPCLSGSCTPLGCDCVGHTIQSSHHRC